VKERDCRWGGGRGADFVAFDCTSQDTTAHGYMVDGVQEASKTASKGAKNGTFCPGKERCAVGRPLDKASSWALRYIPPFSAR